MPNRDLNTSASGAAFTQGSSYIYRYNTSPNTRAAVSQKVRVLTPSYGNNASSQIGVVSSLSVSQSRTVDAIRGIGFGDQIAELVPGVTDPETADFERALLYLSNLWQATGYAAGVDGPVRSLRHHKWPFDIQQELVFSTLADADLDAPNTGVDRPAGQFDGGVAQIQYPFVTPDIDNGFPNGPAQRGHSAILTIYEACWFTSWSASYAADSGQIMESGSVTITDTHDFNSQYGEFLATGNDPSIGQQGSVRFTREGGAFA